MKRPTALLVLVLLSGCGSSTPTSPAPTPPPARTMFNMSGGVIDNKVGTNKVQNASLTIQDGTNAGRNTTADGAGNYQFTNLTPGTFTVALSGPGYISTTSSVTLGQADKTQNFFMDPVPPPIFTTSGVGDNVVSIPSFVTRLRVDATYPGSCQNFIVHYVVGSSTTFLINVIIGTCSVADTRSPFSGTYAITGGGTLQVLNSTGVAWTLTEVR